MKTLARTSALALLGALLLAPAAQGVPPHPDKLTYPKFTYQPPSAKDYRVVLKSGPVAYVAEDRELPLVSINVALRGGTYLSPAGKEGLAELAGYLLARGGTATKTAEELEERLAFLAASLNSGYGADRGTVSLNLLAKDLDEGLAILREVLTAPRFQDDKLKLRRDQLL
ncbi:MAG TPA: insulinase family protein, partial [Thermoanaerobaculia bacterium]|nr:insulinase family protein [Thermoanaerobaculia bacterium]